MSAGSAATLARLAGALGVPAAMFRPPAGAQAPAFVVARLAALLADPDGARLAAAFLAIREPDVRAGLADAVERAAAALADGRPDAEARFHDRGDAP